MSQHLSWEFDYVVINDAALEELKAIFIAGRLTVEGQSATHEAMISELLS